jgi:hypothetical protein
MLDAGSGSILDSRLRSAPGSLTFSCGHRSKPRSKAPLRAIPRLTRDPYRPSSRSISASTAGGAFAPVCGTLAGELPADKLY